MANFRKPQARKQGLKVLAYGEEGSGKSIFGLSFPKTAVVDSESKLGVYESDPEFGRNIVAVADTTNYYDTLELIEEVVKDPKTYNTLQIDSETNIYDGMQVACMEVEEERARKKGGNIDDQTVSMRGYGKIKLNSARLKNLKAQASANGITIVSIAHKEDIFQKVGNENIKIGEKPALRKNSKHDYDVVLRFFKEKDLATGEMKYFAEVEKDTTRTLKVGQVIEKISYEHFKPYIESNQKLDSVKTDYDKAINTNMEDMKREQQDFDSVVKEFTELFQALKKKDASNVAKVTALLKEKEIDSYKNPEHFEKLQEVVGILKTM